MKGFYTDGNYYGYDEDTKQYLRFESETAYRLWYRERYGD